MPRITIYSTPDLHLHFLGAAGTVTGSKYLLEFDGRRILIDCGLFQGFKHLRKRNWDPMAVPPESIDAVVLTHAHIDHSGYLPRLVRNGFDGPIYSTEGTRDLCELLLPDAAMLQEMEAERAARKGYSRHARPVPLYTEEDAREALSHFDQVPYDEPTEVVPGLTARWRDVGHLLGAAAIHLQTGSGSLLFSGDVGRYDDPIMREPKPPLDAETLILESTYGARAHPNTLPIEDLAEVVNETLERRGILLIPSFAVGRTQAILYLLYQLRQARRIPEVPIYIDSPMASTATDIYHRYSGEHRVEWDDYHRMSQMVELVRSVDESKKLNAKRDPAIIISASGMATGGRVLFHIRRLAPHPENTILFAGYQSPGTRGADMVEGARSVKIFGEWIEINASVRQLDNLSGHADYRELTRWVRDMSAPSRVYLTHGEPQSAEALRKHLGAELGWQADVPMLGDRVEIG